MGVAFVVRERGSDRRCACLAPCNEFRTNPAAKLVDLSLAPQKWYGESLSHKPPSASSRPEQWAVLGPRRTSCKLQFPLSVTCSRPPLSGSACDDLDFLPEGNIPASSSCDSIPTSSSTLRPELADRFHLYYVWCHQRHNKPSSLSTSAPSRSDLSTTRQSPSRRYSGLQSHRLRGTGAADIPPGSTNKI
nr:hypothetical protein CFP56_55968 [Quercus suber]